MKSAQMEEKQLSHRKHKEGVRFQVKVALWDLLTALEESDDDLLKEIVGSTGFVARARDVMTQLDSCCGPVPAVEAMLNDIILDEVLKHSDVSDLLQFRLVNKQWYDSATKILAKEKSLKISITGDMLRMHRYSLGLFQDFERLKRVPISTLELEVDIWVTPGILSLQEKNQFTVLHGPHIKTIILSGEVYMVANKFVGFLLKLLNTDFPHVEHFVIRSDFVIPNLMGLGINVYGDPNEDLTTGQVPFLLPSVKTICFEEFAFGGQPVNLHRFLVMLLRAAENLETFTDSSREVSVLSLMALRTTQKQGTLKEVQLDNFSSSLRTPLLLAEMNPKLKIFRVRKYPHFWLPAFTHSMCRILDSSRDSLTHLTIYAFCDTSGALGILSNLKHLHLYFPRDPIVHTKKFRAAMFPKGAVWSDTFPKLETLELELNNFDKKTVKMYYPSDNFKDPEGSVDTSLTVTTLKLDCRFTKFGLNALARKFPNVQSIQVKNYKEFFLNEESIWLSPWSRLEHLELGGFDFRGTFCGRSLDSLFTGFPDIICDRIRNNPEDKNNNTVDFDLRVVTSYPSIRDLHNLKKLKIVFRIPEVFEVGENVDMSLGISYVTAKYAFSVMPLLQVNIVYDQSQRHSNAVTQLLKPLLSYGKVTLVHEAQVRSEE